MLFDFIETVYFLSCYKCGGGRGDNSCLLDMHLGSNSVIWANISDTCDIKLIAFNQ